MVRRAAGGTGDTGGTGTGVRAARRPEVRLPPLEPYGGGGLEPDGDYDGLD
ncbi:pentapeptide repeat-containing protein, partial [Streptomyces sp. TRM76130]|nr:pentapeptide repeat-containing protein [Streptomyces sp. TRM76130]